MDKRLELSGKEASGRPLIHLIEPGSHHGVGETGGLSKTASGEHLPEVLELIESIKPQSDRLYLVNSALGAGEYVGFNLRGDWFTEKGLTHVPPGWHDIPVWDIDARRRAAAQSEFVPKWGDMSWGYPTFYNAHRFRHHVNKDPNRAYGFILGAFWDHRMHRVILVSELIEGLCRKLGASDLYERIKRGEFPDTSMGAKVPYDICSVCGHVAKTPAQYCEHVRKDAMSPYGMRSILPDGRMCGVYNTFPRFFDDSFVFIGAERSAKTMANVTGLVRGNRGYGSSLYTPSRRNMSKAAGYSPGALEPATAFGTAIPTSEKEEQEKELGTALHRAAHQPKRGPGIGEQVSAVLGAVPVASERERAALEHASEKAKRKAHIADGTLTDAELQIWNDKEMTRLKADGVGPAQMDRMRTLLHHQMEKAYGTKQAAAKWAEHLKQIPVPSKHQTELLQRHVADMPPLPRHVLDYIKSDLVRRVRAAAALGVVLTPQEFQYCHLPQDMAEVCEEQNAMFTPMPIDMSHHPRWMPGRPQHQELEDLSSRLGDSLMRRSLVPKVVVVRISRTMPPVQPLPSPAHVVGHEELNKVAQMYNDYRMGLLARPPDWGYVPSSSGASATLGELMKVGAAASTVSTLLLHLAYWPNSLVG